MVRSESHVDTELVVVLINQGLNDWQLQESHDALILVLGAIKRSNHRVPVVPVRLHGLQEAN
jgi:hypothetical protein